MPSRKNELVSNYHLPYNPLLIARAKELRKNMTPAEKKLWFGFLRGSAVRVLRQRPIDNFIVDFYCPTARLVIEIDGGGHFTSEGLSSDASRTEILQGYGLTVIRFTNEDVLSNFTGVCDRLREWLPLHGGPSNPS